MTEAPSQREISNSINPLRIIARLNEEMRSMDNTIDSLKSSLHTTTFVMQQEIDGLRSQLNLEREYSRTLEAQLATANQLINIQMFNIVGSNNNNIGAKTNYQLS